LFRPAVNHRAADDVMWRDDNGAAAIWQMSGANPPAVSFPGGVPAAWITQGASFRLRI